MARGKGFIRGGTPKTSTWRMGETVRRMEEEYDYSDMPGRESRGVLLTTQWGADASAVEARARATESYMFDDPVYRGRVGGVMPWDLGGDRRLLSSDLPLVSSDSPLVGLPHEWLGMSLGFDDQGHTDPKDVVWKCFRYRGTRRCRWSLGVGTTLAFFHGGDAKALKYLTHNFFVDLADSKGVAGNVVRCTVLDRDGSLEGMLPMLASYRGRNLSPAYFGPGQEGGGPLADVLLRLLLWRQMVRDRSAVHGEVETPGRPCTVVLLSLDKADLVLLRSDPRLVGALGNLMIHSRTERLFVIPVLRSVGALPKSLVLGCDRALCVGERNMALLRRMLPKTPADVRERGSEPMALEYDRMSPRLLHVYERPESQRSDEFEERRAEVEEEAARYLEFLVSLDSGRAGPWRDGVGRVDFWQHPKNRPASLSDGVVGDSAAPRLEGRTRWRSVNPYLDDDELDEGGAGDSDFDDAVGDRTVVDDGSGGAGLVFEEGDVVESGGPVDSAMGGPGVS